MGGWKTEDIGSNVNRQLQNKASGFPWLLVCNQMLPILLNYYLFEESMQTLKRLKN